MKEWQFNVLFWVGVGGTVFILFAPAVGLDQVPKNPGAVTGIGVILAYVLSKKDDITKKNGDNNKEPPAEGDEEDAPR